MLRCAAAAVLAAFALVPAVQAQSQTHRNFPPQTLRGDLVLTAPPEVVLNGQPARLAPGARIRGVDNLLATPASLTGARVVVHYTRESTTGLLLDVWVLNAVEQARKPWPTTAAEAAAWSFDPVAQVWSKP